MYLNKQIKNLLYTNTNSIKNILYEQTSSFFDAAMLYSVEHSVIPIFIGNGFTDFIKNSFYSGLWVNDIIVFSQKLPEYAEYYTNYILCIHGDPPKVFKREDLMILKNNLNQYSFLCLDKNKKLWPMDNITYIPYGIIRPNLTTDNKTKDILIINLKKQKQTDVLYQYVKQKFSSTDILHDNILDMNELHKLLSQYKICIDIDNYYNLLVANSCGAYGITATNSDDEYIQTINSSNDIFNILPGLLENLDHRQISEKVIIKYDWKHFCKKVSEYCNNELKKEFIL